MKKVICLFILVAGSFLLSSCGEKKSAGVIKCEESITGLFITLPTNLHDSGNLTDEAYKDAIAEGECAIKACALYEGGASDKELGKWLMEGNAKKYWDSNSVSCTLQAGGKETISQQTW